MTDRRIPFAVFATLAVGAAAGIWFGMPHDREVTSLGVFLLKLLPFALATEAIAWLEPRWLRAPALRLLVIVASFAVYFLYFIPKIFFHSDDYQQMYYYVLTLTPFLILALALAFRLGGGAAGQVRRVAYAMLLLMLSGAEDLAYLTINKQTNPKYMSIPEVWDWASHMTVFVGRPLHRNEAFAFIAIHLVLAALVLTIPARWLGIRRPTAATTPASAAAPITASSGTASSGTASSGTASSGTASSDTTATGERVGETTP